MKTLTGHTLLYDADCPLCRAYTGAFVHNGLLDGAGRHPFQQLPSGWKDRVDVERAQSEIALVDRDGAQVYYGLDALFMVIAHRFPALKPLFRFAPFRWVLQRLYFFISYNRKVIAAVMPGAAADQECRPAFSVRYRIAYLLFAWLIVSSILNAYSHLLQGMIPSGTPGREFLVCGGQVVFQGMVVARIARNKVMDYLGHMMTVSLIGALLMVPGLLLHALLSSLPVWLFAGYFLLVAGLMLLEHMRRMKVLDLGLLPSLNWVAYRCLVLAAIFFL